MSELSYKELQEQGVFDVPYRAFKYMQAQQAKIELLEKELTETQAFLNNQNHIKQAKIDELQARVDDTEKWIESNKKNIPLSEWHDYTTEDYVDADDLLEILKGNKDE